MRWYGVEVQVGRKVECEVAQKCYQGEVPRGLVKVPTPY